MAIGFPVMATMAIVMAIMMAIMTIVTIMMAIAIMMAIVAIMAIAINGYDFSLASSFHTKCEKCQNN